MGGTNRKQLNGMIGKILILTGVIFIVAGLLYLYGVKWYSWFGNLPGDIKIEKPGFSFYFPITSLIIINLAFYLIIWIVRKIL